MTKAKVENLHADNSSFASNSWTKILSAVMKPVAIFVVVIVAASVVLNVIDAAAANTTSMSSSSSTSMSGKHHDSSEEEDPGFKPWRKDVRAGLTTEQRSCLKSKMKVGDSSEEETEAAEKVCFGKDDALDCFKAIPQIKSCFA